VAVRIAEKGNETILHRGTYKKSVSIWKTTKLTGNRSSWKQGWGTVVIMILLQLHDSEYSY